MNWYAKQYEQGIVIDEETGDTIAVTYNPEHAALIAAAPELLAALEAVESDYDGMILLNDGIADKVRAAITKAKG